MAAADSSTARARDGVRGHVVYIDNWRWDVHAVAVAESVVMR